MIGTSAHFVPYCILHTKHSAWYWLVLRKCLLMNNQSPTAYRIHFGVLSLIYKILHSLPRGDHSSPWSLCSSLWFLFFFLSIFILFIYLAAPGLSCIMGDLFFFFFFSSCSMWDLVPWSGIECRPLHWERGVLATGPPEKSPSASDFWQIHSSCPSGPILILLRCLECPTLLYLAPDYLLLTKSQLRYYLPQKAFPDTHTHTHTSPRMNEAPLTEHLEPLTHMSIISLLYSSMMICWVCLQFYTINVLKSWIISSF